MMKTKTAVNKGVLSNGGPGELSRFACGASGGLSSMDVL
jgi:hypothetical protein